MINEDVDPPVLQPQLMAVDSVHILIACLGAYHLWLLILISSAVMQSGMSRHDSMVFVVMFIPGMSSSLSCSCVWAADLLCTSLV